VYMFFCIKLYKRPDDGCQLEPKHVTVNQLRTHEFFRGFSTNLDEDRGQRTGIWGLPPPDPLVKGSGGGCNLVQEI